LSNDNNNNDNCYDLDNNKNKDNRYFKQPLNKDAGTVLNTYVFIRHMWLFVFNDRGFGDTT